MVTRIRVYGIHCIYSRSRYPLEPSLHVITIDIKHVGSVVADGLASGLCRHGKRKGGEGGGRGEAGSTARTIMHTWQTEH